MTTTTLVNHLKQLSLICHFLCVCIYSASVVQPHPELGSRHPRAIDPSAIILHSAGDDDTYYIRIQYYGILYAKFD